VEYFTSTNAFLSTPFYVFMHPPLSLLWTRLKLGLRRETFTPLS